MQRPFHYAVVDEADSILIDEARIPLVIAGDAAVAPGGPGALARIARRLKLDTDFQTDEYERNISLSGAGARRAEEILGCGNLYDEEQTELLAGLTNALHAEHFLRRDVDYIVRQGKVELVDEFTGRVAERRQWPHGLQAAIEAKEKVRLMPEGRILGSMTLQHFIQSYPRLSGMTATAQTSADELKRVYGLEVLVVPTHRPCIREDHPDLVFTHRRGQGTGADRGDRRRARHRPAGAGGHGQRGRVGTAGRQTAGGGDLLPGAQRQERRAGGGSGGRGRRPRGGDHLHQHGRPGRGHPSGRQG